jgi:hypothetical protein
MSILSENSSCQRRGNEYILGRGRVSSPRYKSGGRMNLGHHYDLHKVLVNPKERFLMTGSACFFL